MLWARSDLLEIYLSERLVGLRPTRSAETTWIETSDAGDAQAHLRQAVASNEFATVGRLRVWLSSSLARPFLVSATSGARNRREAKALAMAMAADATGLDGGVRVWLDRWRQGVPAMAVAMPERTWAGLQDLATERQAWRKAAPGRHRVPGIELASVRPWWNVAFDSLLAQGADATVGSLIGWSLADGDGILHGVVERGGVTEVGFDRLAAHDPEGRSLLRRVAAGWAASSAARHLAFERTPSALVPIGGWHDVGKVAA